MPYFFAGFLFIFLDFNIKLPFGGALNLLPDFLGYAIILWAIYRGKQKNAHMCRATITACVATALSLLEYGLNLFAVPLPVPAEFALSIALTLGALYVSYEFGEWAKEIERTRYQKLDTDKISAAWIILCVASLLEYLTVYLPEVALPCYVVHWIAVIWLESAVFHFERALAKSEK